MPPLRNVAVLLTIEQRSMVTLPPSLSIAPPSGLPADVTSLLVITQPVRLTAPAAGPLLIRMPPPPVVPPMGTPSRMVRPEIETAAAPVLISKTRDWPFPLMVSRFAPGPVIVMALETSNSPLVNVISVTLGLNVTVIPGQALLMMSRNVFGPLSALLVTTNDAGQTLLRLKLAGDATPLTVAATV